MIFIRMFITACPVKNDVIFISRRVFLRRRTLDKSKATNSLAHGSLEDMECRMYRTTVLEAEDWRRINQGNA